MQGCEPSYHPLCICWWASPMGSLPWPSPVTPRSPGAQQRVEEEDQDDEEDEDKDGSSSGQEEVSNSEGEWFLESGCCMHSLSLCAQGSSLGMEGQLLCSCWLWQPATVAPIN